MARIGLLLYGQNPFEHKALDGVDVKPAMRAL
jgi:alanine racemase